MDVGDNGDAHCDVMVNARFDHIRTRATVLAAAYAAVLFESLSIYLDARFACNCEQCIAFIKHSGARNKVTRIALTTAIGLHLIRVGK